MIAVAFMIVFCCVIALGAATMAFGVGLPDHEVSHDERVCSCRHPFADHQMDTTDGACWHLGCGCTSPRLR